MLLALLRLCAFHVGFLEHADQSIFLQFGALQAHSHVNRAAEDLVSLFNPAHYASLALMPILAALVRRRPGIALAAGAIILGANATTELVKHLVAAPRPGWLFWDGRSPLRATSWPSGHSTAVMSLVLASMLTVPPRLRPAVAALGGCLAIGVGYSLLATGRHYPSDVIGGFLVATTWTLLTVATLRVANRPWPTERPGSERVSIRAALEPTGLVLAAALVMSAILLISRAHDVLGFVRAHEGFLLGAGAIAALGFALSSGVVLAVRR